VLIQSTRLLGAMIDRYRSRRLAQPEAKSARV
jgi:hypothetical protein